MKSVGVIIASDVQLYSEGLSHLLCADGRVHATRAAGTADDAIRVALDGANDILLLDGSMAAALRVVETVRQESASFPIIIFSVPDNDDELLAFVEAGATAFLARSAPSRDLIEAIVSTLDETAGSPRSSTQLVLRLARYARRPSPPEGTADLTRREREIADLLEAGFSNKEIAGRLAISVATVKNHVHRVLEKLHITRRGQAGHQMRRQPDQRI